MKHFFTRTGIALLCLFSLAHAQFFTPDSGFATNGIAIDNAANDQDGEGVIIQNDGKIVLLGGGDNGNDYDMRVIRRLPDGSPDNSFGTAGAVNLDPLQSDALGFALNQQNDDKLLLAGAVINNDADMLLYRLNQNGVPDSTFGQNGFVTLDFGEGDDFAHAVLIQPDGKILLGGTAAGVNFSEFAAARFNPDGSLDTTFGIGGLMAVPMGDGDASSEDMVLQADGKIVLGGYAAQNMQLDFAILRLLPNGNPDVGFGTGSQVYHDFSGEDDEGRALGLQPDGKLVLAGIASNGNDNDFAAVRFQSNGLIDSGFGTSGQWTLDLDSGSDDFCTSMVIDSTCSIFLGGDAAGTSNTDYALVRLDTSGVADTTVCPGGVCIFPLGGVENLCNAMTLQPDGKLVMAGESDAGSGASDMAMLRLTPIIGCVSTGEFNPGFTSLSCFPNPLSSQSQLTWEQHQSGQVTVQLFDLQGRLREVWLDGVLLGAGKHRVSLGGAESVEAGIYFLQLTIEGRTQTLRLLK